MYRPKAAWATAKSWKHVGAGSIGFVWGSSYDDNDPEMSVMLTDWRLDDARGLTLSLRRSDLGRPATSTLRGVLRGGRTQAVVEIREIEEHPRIIIASGSALGLAVVVSEGCRDPRVGKMSVWVSGSTTATKARFSALYRSCMF